MTTGAATDDHGRAFFVLWTWFRCMAALLARMSTQRTRLVAAMSAVRAVVWSHMADTCAPVYTTRQELTTRCAAAHIRPAASDCLENITTANAALVRQVYTGGTRRVVRMTRMRHLFVATRRWRERTRVRAVNLRATWNGRLQYSSAARTRYFFEARLQAWWARSSMARCNTLVSATAESAPALEVASMEPLRIELLLDRTEVSCETGTLACYRCLIGQWTTCASAFVPATVTLCTADSSTAESVGCCWRFRARKCALFLSTATDTRCPLGTWRAVAFVAGGCARMTARTYAPTCLLALWYWILSLIHI